MPTIAARKPYIVIDNDTDLYYTITAYPIEAPGETREFTVSKSSYDGTAQDLKIDLSPFAFPIFSSTPETTFPTTVDDAEAGVEVGLDVFDGVSTTQYNAFYGWDNFVNDTLGLSNDSIERCITPESKQYITAKLPSTTNIIWRTNSGKIITIANPNTATSKTTVFPVLPVGLTVDGTDKVLTIEGQNGVGTKLWTLNYHIECAWDSPKTIAFVNRFGVWETFDCLGRETEEVSFQREDFRNFSTGGRTQLSSTGEEEFEINTGWVSEDFYDVLKEMMLSTSVVVYTGDGNTYQILPDDKSITKQTSRGDGMINYTLKFKKSNPIIPII